MYDSGGCFVSGGVLMYVDAEAKRICVPPGLYSIRQNAFEGAECTEIEVPDFKTLNLLAEVRRPGIASDEVTLIFGHGYHGSFGSGFSFSSFKVCAFALADEDGDYFAIDGSLYVRLLNGVSLCSFPPAKHGDFHIPDGVTRISGCAFIGAQLGHVTMADSVRYVEPEAFGAASMEWLDIGVGVSTIGRLAFSGLKAGKIAIPGNAKLIGDCAFSESDIEMLQISDGVESIGSYVFTVDSSHG